MLKRTRNDLRALINFDSDYAKFVTFGFSKTDTKNITDMLRRLDIMDILIDNRIKASTKVLASYILWYSVNFGFCNQSINSIAKTLRLGNQTIIGGLCTLQDMNVISKKPYMIILERG